MSDDHDLLRQYAHDGSEAAFNELARRYLDMVWSAARRQVRNAHLAHDVTQAVFIILARKASEIHPPALLSAWLFRTTRYTANNALKMNRRRAHYEKAAAMMRAETSDVAEDDWTDLSPQLDAAIARLSESDRDALLLRYYERQPMSAVAQRFGISVDAAEKRISRAVDKLRTMLRGRSAALSLAIVAALLGSRTVEAAPATLIASAGAESTLAGATLKAMRAGRFAAAFLAAAAAVILAGAIALILAKGGGSPPSRPPSIALVDSSIGPIVSTSPDQYSEVAQLAAHQSGALWMGFTAGGESLTFAKSPAVIGSYAVAQPPPFLVRAFDVNFKESTRLDIVLERVSALAVSSDGGRVAVAWSIIDPNDQRPDRPVYGDGRIHVFDTASKAQVCEIEIPRERVRQLAFMDAQRLLSVDDGSNVVLWNAQTGKEIRRLENKALNIAASSSHIALVTGGRAPESIEVLDLEDRRILGERTTQQLRAISLHGNTLAWIDDKVHVRDLTNPDARITRALPAQEFSACAISPDGARLLLSMRDNTVRLFALNRRPGRR